MTDNSGAGADAGKSGQLLGGGGGGGIGGAPRWYNLSLTVHQGADTHSESAKVPPPTHTHTHTLPPPASLRRGFS